MPTRRLRSQDLNLESEISSSFSPPPRDGWIKERRAGRGKKKEHRHKKEVGKTIWKCCIDGRKRDQRATYKKKEKRKLRGKAGNKEEKVRGEEKYIKEGK